MDKIKSTYEKYEIYIHASKLLNGKVQIVLTTGATYVDEINDIAGNIHSILTSCKLLVYYQFIIYITRQG